MWHQQDCHIMTEQTIQEDKKNESMTDPSKFRSPPPGFKCGEELEEGDGSIGRSGVSFYCILPENKESNDNRDIQRTIHQRRLTFSCRDRSVGVLESQESAITKDEYDATENSTAGDPFFFDAGYTLAGRTGFQVWSGTRLMIESLLFPLPDDSDRLAAIQKEMNSADGRNILELGAGVGVVGTTLAAATGCRILLTDLIKTNLERKGSMGRNL